MRDTISPIRRFLRTLVLFGVLGAILAATMLDRAPAVAEASRAVAAAEDRRQAEVQQLDEALRLATDVGQVGLVAAAICEQRGNLDLSAISRAFGAPSQFVLQASTIVPKVTATNNGNVSVVAGKVNGFANAPGHCDGHDRNLSGGMSPWLAGMISLTCGVGLRLGSLSLMLAVGIPLALARPVSEALGGFLAGFLGQTLTSGRLSARGLAAGLFGAIAGVVGGAASRQIISKMTNLPTQAAAALREIGGDLSFSSAADAAAAQLALAETEWDQIIADFLRANP